MKNMCGFFLFIMFSCFIYSEAAKAGTTINKAITISNNSNSNHLQNEQVSLNDDSHSQKRFWSVITVACLLLLII